MRAGNIDNRPRKNYKTFPSKWRCGPSENDAPASKARQTFDKDNGIQRAGGSSVFETVTAQQNN